MEYIKIKTIMQKVKTGSSWFGVDYNINLYRGCSHACIYCDSRSSCYKIENFDKIKGKEDAIAIFEKEIKTKRNIGVVGIGAMSDTYNPCEQKERITEKALRVIEKNSFGLSVITKSDLIIRDKDIIKSIAKKHSAIVIITITAADDNLSSIIEPNVCVSSKRFEIIKEFAKEGIFTGIALMPILPFITDTKENIESIMNKAKDSGCSFIYPSFGVTLRENQRDYYYKKLDEHFPKLKEDYIKIFGENYSCMSTSYKSLKYIFEKYAEKHSMLYKMKDIIKAYKKEPSEQFSFNF